MKKILKRLATGFLAFATIVTRFADNGSPRFEKQYWTESAERVGIVEKVMNDGSIGSTFNEGHMTLRARTLSAWILTPISATVIRPEPTQAHA